MKAIVLLLSSASILFGVMTRDTARETVYDDRTHLTWVDDANASSQMKNWSDAIDYCEALEFADRRDWRLPNINELLSIVDLSRSNPAVFHVFLHTAGWGYWSSTTWRNGAGTHAWYTDFENGPANASYKTDSCYVRCVRGGFPVPTFLPAVLLQLLE